MKKVILFFFLIPVIAIAQDSTSKFLVGISFSNDVCNRFSDSNQDIVELKNDFDSLESFRLGQTVGISAGYLLRSNLTLQTGVYFANRGYKIDTLIQAGLTNVRFKFRYIEVPVSLSYIFPNSWKLRPFVSAGLSLGFALQHRIDYNLIVFSENEFYRDDQKLSSVVFGANASIGFQKAIQDKYLFQCEAIYRQSVSAISSTPLKRYLNATGINLSLIRKF